MTKLDKEIQNQLYDPDPETQGKMKGILHYAIDKLFDPNSKNKGVRIDKVNIAYPKQKPMYRYDLVDSDGSLISRFYTEKEAMFWLKEYQDRRAFDPKAKSKDKGTLKITGDKPKLTRLKKHLEKEHPSTKGHMKVLDPASRKTPKLCSQLHKLDEAHSKQVRFKDRDATQEMQAASDYANTIISMSQKLCEKGKAYDPKTAKEKYIAYYKKETGKLPSQREVDDYMVFVKGALYDPKQYSQTFFNETIRQWTNQYIESGKNPINAQKLALKRYERIYGKTTYPLPPLSDEAKRYLDPKRVIKLIKEMSDKELLAQFTDMGGFDASADIEAEDEELFERLRKEIVARKLYDPKKPAEIYVVTDSKGNKHKASYSEWLKWMREQTKEMYDPKKDDKDSFSIKTEKGEYIVKAYNRPQALQIFNQEIRYKSQDFSELLEAKRMYDPKSVSEKQLKIEYQEYVNYFYSGAIHGDRPMTYEHWKQAREKYYDPRRHSEDSQYLKKLAEGKTRPPKNWFYAMVQGIKKRSDVTNPYAIVGNIWRRLKPSKRLEIKRREEKGERFSYDLPLPKDVDTKGIGTLRMVKPFKLAEAQVNVSAKDMKEVKRSGIFKPMKRQDGTTAQVARCKSKTPVNLFIDEV